MIMEKRKRLSIDTQKRRSRRSKVNASPRPYHMSKKYSSTSIIASHHVWLIQTASESKKLIECFWDVIVCCYLYSVVSVCVCLRERWLILNSVGKWKQGKHYQNHILDRISKIRFLKKKRKKKRSFHWYGALSCGKLLIFNRAILKQLINIGY